MISRAICASAGNAIVEYGCAQSPSTPRRLNSSRCTSIHLLREGAALAAELDDRHRVLVLAPGAVVLLDLPFDRQPVAVPARHVVRVVPEHLLRAHYKVLENLVERVPDVDVAVGVGRPVVQHETRHGPAPPRAGARTGSSPPSAPGAAARAAAGPPASESPSAAETASRSNRARTARLWRRLLSWRRTGRCGERSAQHGDGADRGNPDLRWRRTQAKAGPVIRARRIESARPMKTPCWVMRRL